MSHHLARFSCQKSSATLIVARTTHYAVFNYSWTSEPTTNGLATRTPSSAAPVSFGIMHG
ncbi:hypothetical protein OH77DRAFT_1417660 [Trametes cingulata]|nr:hypothetical protein OH77DRAFT_1417660 [Trametes cingulata]